jgi:hypothetical protein
MFFDLNPEVRPCWLPLTCCNQRASALREWPKCLTAKKCPFYRDFLTLRRPHAGRAK